MNYFSCNRYCFPWKTSCATGDFLSHKRIVLGVKVLVRGCQGGSPAVITFLAMWLPTGKVLAGTNSSSASFALSCRALPEWLFLFNMLLFLCVVVLVFLFVWLGFFFCLLLVCVSASPCCEGCKLMVLGHCLRKLNRLSRRTLGDDCNS